MLAMKIEKASDALKLLPASCSLKLGDIFTTGQKYDLEQNWGAGEYEKGWGRTVSYNSDEIQWRVEELDADSITIRATKPVAFACLYKSGVYGEGPCTADKICRWFAKEFVQNLGKLRKENEIKKRVHIR
jgi:hypothetical protein